MEPGAEQTQTRRYFPELDGVRAVATLMVMAFHFSQYWWPKRFMMFGQTGVDLFFVLSGFLITMILMDCRGRDWGEIRRFYLRRTLRIFPLYYGYLGLCLALGSGVSVWYWVYGENIAVALKPGLVGPAQFWSLAVEEQFYLMWPFLVIFLPRRMFVRAAWGIVLGSLVLRVAFAIARPEFTAISILRFDGLAAGGLVAIYYRRGTLGQLRGLLKVGMILGVGLLAFEWWMTHGNGLPWVMAVKYSSAALLYGAAIGLVIATRATVMHAILRAPVMRAIGRVSYGMYVFHPAIFHWLPPHLGHMPLPVEFAVCLGVSYLISAASFYGMERHFIGLKDRLISGRTRGEISTRTVGAEDVVA
jgi:peptidoglycan/LPS O-acetylase OafA/YrhL